MSSLKEAFVGLDETQGQFFIQQQVKFNEVEPRRFQPNEVKGNLGPSITGKTLAQLSAYDPYTNKIKQPVTGAAMGQLLQGQADTTKEEIECRNYIGINGIEQLIRDTSSNPNNPVRCGWRYEKSPGLMPTVARGALGTINGPLNANDPEDKLTKDIKWIWNLEKAKKRMLSDLANSLPTANSMKVLQSLGGGNFMNRFGWCGTNGTFGRMIPVNADGTPTYGRDPTLGCPPSRLWTNVNNLPAPATSQNAVQASKAAFIQPLLDCATAGNSVSLTRDCFLQAIKNSQCKEDGTLYQSLQLANPGESRWDSYLNSQPSFEAYQSRQGANALTTSLFQKNQGKWETAIADIARMQKAITNSRDPYVKVAAHDLCMESGYFDSYDFCRDIPDTTDINSVELHCIRNFWQENNGKPAGTAYPTSKRFDPILGTLRTWLDYKNAVKRLKDNTGSTDPMLQRKSMDAFYGVRVGTRAFSPKNINSTSLEPTPPCYDYGTPSADKQIRVYNQTECTKDLDGNFYSNGECLKKQGGSYSWDCRYLNANDTSNTLVLWLDANDGSTLIIDSNNRVKNWNDKSGKGNNIIQMDVERRPIYKAASLPFIQFNGNALLPLPNPLNLVRNFFTIFVVEQRTSGKDMNCLFGGTAYGQNLDLVAGYRYNTSAMMAFWANDLDIYNVFQPYREGDPYRIWCFHYGSTGRSMHVNGKRLGSDRNPAGGLRGYENGSIGHYAGNFYVGNIAEILIYNPSLDSDVKRQKIEGYLAAKWGLQGILDGSHPYKFVSP
jgi:hypothetical protein